MTPAEIYSAIHMLVSAALMPAAPVNGDQIQTVNDLGLTILHCYRPSANFASVRVLQAPWVQGRSWKADGSAVLAISYVGNAIRLRHVLEVAVMYRQKQFIALPIKDTSNALPFAKDCALKNWTPAAG